MLKKSITCLLVAVTVSYVFTSCAGGSSSAETKDGLQGEITISGAFALYPLVVKWAEEFQKENPGVRIDVSAGGAGKGMTDVLSNMADLGMVSREVYPTEIEKGAYPIGVAIDAVVATVSASNPLLSELKKVGLTKDKAVTLWIHGNYKTWETVLGRTGSTPVRVYTRSDACGAAETFAAWMGYKQENLNGAGVFGDPGVADAVQKDALGIGYNNLGYVFDEQTRKPNVGLDVIPLDVNGNGRIDPDEDFYVTKDDVIKAIMEGKYPSPPARELYLVSNGKPTNPVLVAFIRYILTRGQDLNTPAGYVRIADDKIQSQLKALEK
jgi:phosphate transport system substrate-binding protein